MTKTTKHVAEREWMSGVFVCSCGARLKSEEDVFNLELHKENV